MNYQEAINFIENSHKFGMRLGLENSYKLLELLGNPQDKLKFIHVAGTNGKGSVCSFISNTFGLTRSSSLFGVKILRLYCLAFIIKAKYES